MAAGSATGPSSGKHVWRFSLLSATAKACSRSPGLILLVAALSLLGCLVVAGRTLSFSTDRTELLAPSDPTQEIWQQFRQEFGKTSDFVVLVSGGQTSQRERAVEALGRALVGESSLFEAPFYRLDFPQLAEHGLYYLSVPDLRRMIEQLKMALPWLELLGRPDGLDAVRRVLTQSSPGSAARRLEASLPLLNRILTQLDLSLQSRGHRAYQSPLGSFSPEIELTWGPIEPGQTRFYNQLPDGQTHVLVVRARRHEGVYSSDVEALQRLSTLIDEAMRNYPELSARLSGEPAINTEEMLGAQRDALRAGLLGAICIIILLGLAFQAVVRPLLLMLALLVGLGWSFGWAALTVGKLNLITVNFATVLLGLGLTFGIQILYRYQEERSQNRSPEEALERTLTGAGKENLVGALTTAVAFWALSFTSFRAAGQLGIITGTGVTLCYLSMLTVLPSLIMLHERYAAGVTAVPSSGWMLRGERFLERYPGWVLLLSLGLTLYSLTWAQSIPFDYNLLHMSPADSEAVSTEHFLQGQGYSSLYALTVAAGPEEAEKLAAALAHLTAVSRVESVTSLVPRRIEVKQPLVKEVVQLSRHLVLPGPAVPLRSAQQLLTLKDWFEAMQSRIGELLPWFKSATARQRAQQLLQLMKRAAKDILKLGPGQIQSGLGRFESELVGDLTTQFTFLKAQQATPPDMLTNLPEALRLRSVGVTGKYCIRSFPAADVWEQQPLERFVAQLQSVDPKVTGPPVLIHAYLEGLRTASSASARSALLVIAVLLLLHFRSLGQASLAMFPKLLGLLWMIGVMGFLKVEFNAANFLAMPLTLGIGLIFGVQVILQSLQKLSLFDSSSGPSIVLSGLAIMIGFATLMSAGHRGIASLGLVMTIGVGTNLLTALIVLPALLALLKRVESSSPAGKNG